MTRETKGAGMAVKMTGFVERALALSGVGTKAKLMGALSRSDRSAGCWEGARERS